MTYLPLENRFFSAPKESSELNLGKISKEKARGGGGGSTRFQQTLLTSLTMLYLSLSKLYSCKSLWHFIIMDDNGDDDDIEEVPCLWTFSSAGAKGDGSGF